MSNQPLELLAERIARNAHRGQFRRDGVTPYIQHPEGVVARLRGESEEVISAAWLHDVLEDSKVVADDLSESGVPRAVVSAVVALTHMPDEPYENYLRVIRENPIAIKVKVADMLHNLSDAPTGKQVLKYARGLIVLLA